MVRWHDTLNGCDEYAPWCAVCKWSGTATHQPSAARIQAAKHNQLHHDEGNDE